MREKLMELVEKAKANKPALIRIGSMALGAVLGAVLVVAVRSAIAKHQEEEWRLLEEEGTELTVDADDEEGEDLDTE